MMGKEPTANAFAKYYHAHFYPSTDEDNLTLKEFGGYNFSLPKKANSLLVPTFRNKRDDWSNYWFYAGVATDKEVAASVSQNLPRANALVSQMTPMVGYKHGDFSSYAKKDEFAEGAFLMTGKRQISRDLFEEGVALDFWSLGQNKLECEFEEWDGYIRPKMVLELPPAFPDGMEYVSHIERLANYQVGANSDAEHEKKILVLGNSPRLNRVFDLMCIAPPEREDPKEKRKRENLARTWGERVSRGKRGRGHGPSRGRGRGGSSAGTSSNAGKTIRLETKKRRVISGRSGPKESGDVIEGRQMAVPVGFSRKVTSRKKLAKPVVFSFDRLLPCFLFWFLF